MPKNEVKVTQFDKAEVVTANRLYCLENITIESANVVTTPVDTADLLYLDNVKITGKHINLSGFDFNPDLPGWHEYLKALGFKIEIIDGIINLQSPKKPITLSCEEYNFFIDCEELGKTPKIIHDDEDRFKETVVLDFELDLSHTAIVGSKVSISAANLLFRNTLIRCQGDASNISINNSPKNYITRILKESKSKNFGYYTTDLSPQETIICTPDQNIKLIDDDPDKDLRIEYPYTTIDCLKKHKCHFVKLFDIKRQQNIKNNSLIHTIIDETGCRFRENFPKR